MMEFFLSGSSPLIDFVICDVMSDMANKLLSLSLSLLAFHMTRPWLDSLSLWPSFLHTNMLPSLSHRPCMVKRKIRRCKNLAKRCISVNEICRKTVLFCIKLRPKQYDVNTNLVVKVR